MVNYCARLEFQDGKRKKPKHNYNPDNQESRGWGRGAVHLHLLLWHEDGDVACLKNVLSGTTPVSDPIMTGYVLGSQTSWGESGWQEHAGPNSVNETSQTLELQHTETDSLNG